MHTDDHILEHFLAAKHPLPALATHLGMTLIALVHWVDRNADLLAAAKRSLETHLAFLALNAEAAALIDLTKVSHSTTNEERKRKSSSQLLRHAAKRLLTNPTRERGAPCASASTTRLLNQLASSPPSPRLGGEKVPSTEGARGMRGSASAPSTNPERDPPPSPRPVGGGEKVPSTAGARGMRGSASASSTNPERKLMAPCASEPLNALSESAISPPSPRPVGGGEKVLSTEGARGMRGIPNAELSSTNPERDPPPSPRWGGEKVPSTEGARGMRGTASAPDAPSESTLPRSDMQSTPTLNFSDHEIDVLMATLARHFNIDLTSDDPAPA